MNPRKAQLHQMVVDILSGKETVMCEPSNFNHLAIGVAEILNRGRKEESIFRHREDSLEDEDWKLVNEIYWDLVTERAITPGLDMCNAQYPWFRVHAGRLLASKPLDL